MIRKIVTLRVRVNEALQCITGYILFSSQEIPPVFLFGKSKNQIPCTVATLVDTVFTQDVQKQLLNIARTFSIQRILQSTFSRLCDALLSSICCNVSRLQKSVREQPDHGVWKPVHISLLSFAFCLYTAQKVLKHFFLFVHKS